MENQEQKSTEAAEKIVDNKAVGQETPSTGGPAPSKSNKKIVIIILVAVALLFVVPLMIIFAALVISNLQENKDDTVDQTNIIIEDQTSQTAPAALTCLSQDDYKYFFFDKKPATVTYDDTFELGKTNNVQSSMFFEPDSTEETSFSSIYDDWAEFSTMNSNKQWGFVIRGSVFQPDSSTLADQDSVKLANDRANTVKTELENRGVPTDRITIAEPLESNETYTAGSQAEIYRRVEVYIDPTCSQS